jgi:hypothetical protein
MMTVESNEESTSTPKSSNAGATDRISSEQQGVEIHALQGAVSTNIDPFAARPSHQLSWANANMKVSRKGKPDIQVYECQNDENAGPFPMPLYMITGYDTVSSNNPDRPSRHHFNDNATSSDDKRALVLQNIELSGRRSCRTIHGDVLSQESFETELQELVDSGRKILLCVHGFHTRASSWLKACGSYANAVDNPTFVVIAVVWPCGRKDGWLPWGVVGKYWKARTVLAPSAIQAFQDMLQIRSTIARSLMCHSMGNYFLECAIAAPTQLMHYFDIVPEYDDIFMVAADVKNTIFDKAENVDRDSPIPESHILYENNQPAYGIVDIPNLARYSVHVLHSSKDIALKMRFVLHLGGSALGYNGCPREHIGNDIVRARVVNHDCSSFSGDLDWKRHGYAFTTSAIRYYEVQANLPREAADNSILESDGEESID